MRRKFIAGNWKMHKTKEEAQKYIGDLKLFVKDVKDADIVICVPFTLLDSCSSSLKGSNIFLGAQDMHHEKEGAYTGEISAKMIKEFAEHVIIGHSERRIYFNEENEVINKKIKAALVEGLKPILCVGESLEEKENGHEKQVVETQIRECLKDISISMLDSLVIAYEPVWAIGTGKTATPIQAEEMHSFIRQIIRDNYDNSSADNIRIIYGGSVTPKNSAEIMSIEDIDGCLPGGASLDPGQFAEIIKLS